MCIYIFNLNILVDSFLGGNLEVAMCIYYNYKIALIVHSLGNAIRNPVLFPSSFLPIVLARFSGRRPRDRRRRALTRVQNLKDGRKGEKLLAGSRFPGYARWVAERTKGGRNMSSRERQSEIAKRRETRYPADGGPRARTKEKWVAEDWRETGGEGVRGSKNLGRKEGAWISPLLKVARRRGRSYALERRRGNLTLRRTFLPPLSFGPLTAPTSPRRDQTSGRRSRRTPRWRRRQRRRRRCLDFLGNACALENHTLNLLSLSAFPFLVSALKVGSRLRPFHQRVENARQGWQERREEPRPRFSGVVIVPGGSPPPFPPDPSTVGARSSSGGTTAAPEPKGCTCTYIARAGVETGQPSGDRVDGDRGAGGRGESPRIPGTTRGRGGWRQRAPGVDTEGQG